MLSSFLLFVMKCKMLHQLSNYGGGSIDGIRKGASSIIFKKYPIATLHSLLQLSVNPSYCQFMFPTSSLEHDG